MALATITTSVLFATSLRVGHLTLVISRPFVGPGPDSGCSSSAAGLAWAMRAQHSDTTRAEKLALVGHRRQDGETLDEPVLGGEPRQPAPACDHRCRQPPSRGRRSGDDVSAGGHLAASDSPSSSPFSSSRALLALDALFVLVLVALFASSALRPRPRRAASPRRALRPGGRRAGTRSCSSSSKSAAGRLVPRSSLRVFVGSPSAPRRLAPVSPLFGGDFSSAREASARAACLGRALLRVLLLHHGGVHLPVRPGGKESARRPGESRVRTDDWNRLDVTLVSRQHGHGGISRTCRACLLRCAGAERLRNSRPA